MGKKIILSCHKIGHTYEVYLKVDHKLIWLDKTHLTHDECTDLHNELEPAFSRCGIDLSLDIME